MPAPTPPHRRLAAVLVAAPLLAGCASPGLGRLDRAVTERLVAASDDAGVNTRPRTAAEADDARFNRPLAAPVRDAYAEQPSTENPGARDLAFRAAVDRDAEAVIQRLDGYAVTPDDSLVLDLEGALRYAIENSREYRFLEEDYVLSCLRLLIEEHRWGPRWFSEVSATVDAEADDGTYDSALRLVGELGVTQRLPYGGNVSASLLASATEDLHERVAGENVQSASFLLSADVPLLRGSGLIAREDLIQSRRDLVYAARDFERGRRAFLFDVASDYLDLILSFRRIDIAARQVAAFEQVEQQQQALLEGGRVTPFDAAEAQNERLEAVDSLNGAREGYRLALDRFKVRLGMPIDQPLELEPDTLGLPLPEVGLEEAVVAGLTYRLDLQNARDQVDDARRSLAIAKDNLRGDLDLSGSLRMPTDPDLDRAGLQLDPDELDLSASITYGLPLDREIERLSLRSSAISLARSERSFARFRDDVAIQVRAAVRGIDSAAFSLEIQERNLEIARNRRASIEADPSRANIRQKTDAINQEARAENARDAAIRDLELEILGFLLDTGQLRVRPDGTLAPLDGMELREPDPQP